MFKFIFDCRSLPFLRAHYATSLPIYRLFSSPSSSSSSALNSPSNSTKEKSFTVNYLINSCGFPPESALSISKHLHFKTPNKPDSVLALFKNHGFSHTQIVDVVKRYPKILLSDPDKTLSPKLEFFSSIGLSIPDLARVISAAPTLMIHSLENRIIPAYNFYRDLFKSDERTLSTIKRYPYSLTYDLQVCGVQNIQILRDVGVPESNILFYISYQSNCLLTYTDNFQKIVKKVKEMGFNPSKHSFMHAFKVLRSMSKSTREKKVELFKTWGWSEDDILVAFRKDPLCMTVSEDKITRVMDFLINKVGLKYSLLVNSPTLFSMSFEKRIVPRCLFYQVVLDKGLIKKEKEISSIIGWIKETESRFIRRIEYNYKEEAPLLLKLYQAKLNLAK